MITKEITKAKRSFISSESSVDNCVFMFVSSQVFFVKGFLMGGSAFYLIS